MADVTTGATMRDVVALGTLADNVSQIASAPLNANSGLTYVASLIVKPTPGVLYGFAGYSSKGSAQFIEVFDANALPADGATPVLVLTVGASGNFSYNPGTYGRRFNTGIVIANSSTAPLKAIGSADCYIDAQYR